MSATERRILRAFAVALSVAAVAEIWLAGFAFHAGAAGWAAFFVADAAVDAVIAWWISR